MTKPVHAADVLAASIDETGSRACVGLDPRPALLPESLKARMLDEHGPGAGAVGAAFAEFNRQIIKAVAGRCAAVKPQIACYEAYGLPGWQAFSETVEMAREAGIPVIVDAKRNDMGSTAVHYGQAFFGGAPDLDDNPLGGIGCNWLTVNGYLGFDGVEPLVGVPGSGRGVFVLVKTSNPGSGELQDTPSRDHTVADTVADLVCEWGQDRLGACGLSDVGAVVGATYPDHARQLRQRMPNTYFLVPGYGAQGGGAADALAGARPDGSGVLVSSSRGIIAAWQQVDTDDWATAAADALDVMNTDLASAI